MPKKRKKQGQELLTDIEWELVTPKERRAFVVRALKDAARTLDRGINLWWGPGMWKAVESFIGKDDPKNPPSEVPHFKPKPLREET
jgi:hypothetical protein